VVAILEGFGTASSDVGVLPAVAVGKGDNIDESLFVDILSVTLLHMDIVFPVFVPDKVDNFTEVIDFFGIVVDPGLVDGGRVRGDTVTLLTVSNLDGCDGGNGGGGDFVVGTIL